MLSVQPTMLARLDPFAEVRRLQSDLDRLFDRAGASGGPPVNVWMGETSLVVTAELPGLSRDDIELSVEDDTLTISGQRSAPAEGETVTWYRRERPSGAFTRTVRLPFRVDPDNVEARVKDGVLAVRMERPQQDRPRRIEIRSS